MMTRREFIKVAGAGVLAVSCAGMLSGCDVVDSIKEELEDQGAAKATIGKVTFMMETSAVQSSTGNGFIGYSTLFHIRNKSSDTVKIPKENITGKICDFAENWYNMQYTGTDIEVEKDSDKVKIKDFALKTIEEVPSESSLKSVKYKKAIITIAYNGKKAVFTDDNETDTITPNVENA